MLRRRRLKGRAPARVRPGREVGRLAGVALLAVGVPFNRIYQIAEEGCLFGDGRAVRGLAAPLDVCRLSDRSSMGKSSAFLVCTRQIGRSVIARFGSL